MILLHIQFDTTTEGDYLLILELPFNIR